MLLELPATEENPESLVVELVGLLESLFVSFTLTFFLKSSLIMLHSPLGAATVAGEESQSGLGGTEGELQGVDLRLTSLMSRKLLVRSLVRSGCFISL